MQNNPDKFTQLFDSSAPYRTESPWYRAMQSGNFELIDHVALRQQLKLLKINYAKQLILEGLMEKPEVSETTLTTGISGSPFWSSNTNVPNTMLTSATMKQAAQDLMKAEVHKQFKEEYAKYKAKNRYVK
jgi:hypothetical protein